MEVKQSQLMICSGKLCRLRLTMTDLCERGNAEWCYPDGTFYRTSGQPPGYPLPHVHNRVVLNVSMRLP